MIGRWRMVRNVLERSNNGVEAFTRVRKSHVSFGRYYAHKIERSKYGTNCESKTYFMTSLIMAIKPIF
jgi:hypothetical protein